MDIIGIILLALTGVILSLLIKPNSREFSVVLSLLVCCIILAFGANLLSPTIDFIKTLSKNVNGEYVKCLIKCVGICCISSFAQDMCFDNNERGIASAVEFTARAGVTVTILPVIKELTEIAFDLM